LRNFQYAVWNQNVAENLPVKDVSSTAFGFVIGFLLPGFAGMFGISLFAPPVQQLFSQFIEAESNVGRFLLMILCSLVVGLEVSVIRWLLFEKWLCRKYKRDESKYRHLGDDSKLAAFRAAVDENYRYHQFFGGMAVVTPLIGWGLVWPTSGWLTLTLGAVFLVLEGLNVAGAISAYRNYIDRTDRILEGSTHDEWLGTDRRRARQEARPASSATAATTSSATPAATAPKTLTDNEACEVTSAESPP
jgi:hypothetical protein